jgi:hypothetical protein
MCQKQKKTLTGSPREIGDQPSRTTLYCELAVGGRLRRLDGLNRQNLRLLFHILSKQNFENFQQKFYPKTLNSKIKPCWCWSPVAPGN